MVLGVDGPLSWRSVCMRECKHEDEARSGNDSTLSDVIVPELSGVEIHVEEAFLIQMPFQ